jgi:hypothetical protein
MLGIRFRLLGVSTSSTDDKVEELVEQGSDDGKNGGGGELRVPRVVTVPLEKSGAKSAHNREDGQAVCDEGEERSDQEVCKVKTKG